MSVLLGETFADICFTLWGADWKAHAEKRLKRSRRQLHRIAAGEHKVSRQLRLELEAVVDEQITALQTWKRELR